MHHCSTSNDGGIYPYDQCYCPNCPFNEHQNIQHVLFLSLVVIIAIISFIIMTTKAYEIGTPGLPRGWQVQQNEPSSVPIGFSSSSATILQRPCKLSARFSVCKICLMWHSMDLSHKQDADHYPLFAIKTKDWDTNKVSLITGGVWVCSCQILSSRACYRESWVPWLLTRYG